MKNVILVNVGTPRSPQPDDVADYLNQFLMDEDIISIPRPFRDFLVKVLIVPRRKSSSSEKYKRIWTPEGSPLLIESEKLKLKLQRYLDTHRSDRWKVFIGMQFGEPSLKEILLSMSDQDELYFCPMYPQLAQGTTGASLKILKQRNAFILQPFHSEEWFVGSVLKKIQPQMGPKDHLLLSYHGLPLSHVKKPGSSSYMEHCFRTSKLVQNGLQLTDAQISTSFQSRLGPTKWIEPSSEHTIRELRQRGIQNLVVACPSFVSDCLETLEEIGLDLKKQFLDLGGESFKLAACVNDDDFFVRGLAEKIISLGEVQSK